MTFITASNPRVTRLAAAVEANEAAAWRHAPTEPPAVVVTPRRKYIALDLDHGGYRSGRFLIEGERVYTIAAYGRKNHYAGTLDDVAAKYEAATESLKAKGDRVARLTAMQSGTYKAGE